MKLLTLSLLLSSVAFASTASETHWEYSGKHGTAHWGEISPKFSTCSTGVNQSPIDIKSTIEAELPALTLDYNASKIELINNGHTIQANIAGKNTFTNDDGKFDLKQFHFHSPSENTINGQSFPLEVHFVHADDNGRLAVIGLMFKEGKENKVLAKFWDEMPAKAGKKAAIAGSLQSLDLLPANASKDYYRFNGSLTTPPCSEGVRWFVVKEPVEASKAQIDKFYKLMGGATNRPVQPVNARVVLR